MNQNSDAQYEKAIASYDKALESQPQDSSPEVLGEIWCERGCALYNLGRYEEASASFDKAVEYYPDNLLCWFNRGKAKYKVQHYEAAVVCFEKVLEKYPQNPEIWQLRCLSLINLGRFEEAVISGNRAFRCSWGLKPDEAEEQKVVEGLRHADSWCDWAEILANPANGWYYEALICLDQALELDSNHYRAWKSRGDVLVNYAEAFNFEREQVLKMLSDAVTCYDWALEISPNISGLRTKRKELLRKLKSS